MLNKIIANGFCTGCGACVSEDKSKKSFMQEDEYGFLIPSISNVPETDIKKMLHVCPFNPFPKNEVEDEDKLANIYLGDAEYRDEQIGHYNNLYVGYSNEFRKTSSSGGIATFIFQELLKRKIVDKLFVVIEKDGEYKYQFFNKGDQIESLSKTRYIPVTMEELFKEIENVDGTVAVSGVGCFLKAIRLKQFYYPHLKTKIPFLVGIICGGVKSKFFTDYLAKQAGIDGKYSKQEYRIKNPTSTSSDYSFGALDEKNEFLTVRMKSLGDMWGTGMFKSIACDFCDDVTTELADISLGDAWFQPYLGDGLGNSVIVTRSKIADQLIFNGISELKLTVDKIDLETFKRSQRGSFNHRQKALQFRVTSIKKKLKVIPSVRDRFFKKISIELQIIQRFRMSIRKKSLEYWKKDRNLKTFEKRMRLRLLLLKILTKLSHKIKTTRREK